METGLKNRVAIVAASSQGIGRATADALAAEGCRVAMCARNRESLHAAAEKIRSQHHAEVIAEPFDVTDAGAVRDFVTAVVAKFGSVDICVTNAGGPPAKGFLATTINEPPIGSFAPARMSAPSTYITADSARFNARGSRNSRNASSCGGSVRRRDSHSAGARNVTNEVQVTISSPADLSRVNRSRLR